MNVYVLKAILCFFRDSHYFSHEYKVWSSLIRCYCIFHNFFCAKNLFEEVLNRFNLRMNLKRILDLNSMNLLTWISTALSNPFATFKWSFATLFQNNSKIVYFSIRIKIFTTNFTLFVWNQLKVLKETTQYKKILFFP